jgi:hypothetical protein
VSDLHFADPLGKADATLLFLDSAFLFDGAESPEGTRADSSGR